MNGRYVAYPGELPGQGCLMPRPASQGWHEAGRFLSEGGSQIATSASVGVILGMFRCGFAPGKPLWTVAAWHHVAS